MVVWRNLFVLMICVYGTPFTASGGAKNPPNIVLLMCDDLGYGDTGFNGNATIHTPNLDRMAKAGARLDRFYVGSPLCVPSRAGLLTGRIAIRCGISNHRGARRNQRVAAQHECHVPRVHRKQNG